MIRLSYWLACLVSFLAWVNVSSVVAGPLSTAAESGDVEEVDRLLNEGADINEGSLAPPCSTRSKTILMRLMF